MSHKKFILGFIITLALLFFITSIFLKIPLQPTIVFMFLVVASIMGLLLALSRKGVHHGHALTAIGFSVVLVLGAILSSAIDMTIQGKVVEKSFSLAPSMITILIVGIAIGVVLMLIGIYRTVGMFGGRKR